MKSTGIVRKVDMAGRLVLPISLRRTLGLADGEGSVEIFVDENTIILRRYTPSCLFCDSMDNLLTYNDSNICRACAARLGSLAEDNIE